MDNNDAAVAMLHVMREMIGQRKAGLTVRDPREPGRSQKERVERKVKSVVDGLFYRQGVKLEQRMQEIRFSLSKAAGPDFGDIFDGEDAEAEGELARYVFETRLAGIEAVSKTLGVSVDWTGVRTDALHQARLYVGTLIRGINQTTLEAVRTAVTGFVETPRFTMGDLVRSLLDSAFSPDRAWMIAATEVTRAYADGQVAAMGEVRKEFPDLRVTKTWFTNNDDIVCPVCGPLDGVEVGMDAVFVDGIEQPPAHPKCRCWMSVGAKADGATQEAERESIIKPSIPPAFAKNYPGTSINLGGNATIEKVVEGALRELTDQTIDFPKTIKTDARFFIGGSSQSGVAAYFKDVLYINNQHPFWINPTKDMAESFAKKEFSTDRPEHPIWHEVGHYLQEKVDEPLYNQFKRSGFLDVQDQKIANSVSSDAAISASEFFAEMFATRMAGTFSNNSVDALSLFVKYGGGHV